jgi:hypothetical protein
LRSRRVAPPKANGILPPVVEAPFAIRQIAEPSAGIRASGAALDGSLVPAPVAQRLDIFLR